jgi:hypothetical protein
MYDVILDRDQNDEFQLLKRGNGDYKHLIFDGDI